MFYIYIPGVTFTFLLLPQFTHAPFFKTSSVQLLPILLTYCYLVTPAANSEYKSIEFS